MDVVRIQLDAFQNSDIIKDDRPYRIIFEFSSPLQQNVIGSHNYYDRLVKNPLYSALVGFERASVNLIDYRNGLAYVEAIIQRKYTVHSFLFTVRRQKAEPYADCWLTENLIPYNARSSV